MEKTKEGLHLVLLGKTASGKSATGNTILGGKAFISKKSPISVTRDVAKKSGTFDGLSVTVHDTPGLFGTDMSEDEVLQKYKDVLQECKSHPCVFLLVIRADRFTEEERKTVEKIEELLGENQLQNTWIIFTRGDELDEENMTINEFIDGTEDLKNVIEKYTGRCHVFNNKSTSKTQGPMLLGSIMNTLRIDSKNRINLHTRPNTSTSVNNHIPVDKLPVQRIVLLGKTGAGKSAAGNLILGQKEFKSEMSTLGVTRTSSMKQNSDRIVSVVDTPGFFDPDMKPEDLVTEIGRSVYLSSPGPHAFLIVFPVNMRFTDEEQQIPQRIETLFGEEVLKYSIILFTHGDLLEKRSIEELIEENSELRSLVQQCGGGYHVFNNKELNNRGQVTELLQKIDTMIQQNGGGHYTNQMYQDALRCRQEEEERRQREEEERRRDEEERLRDEEERRREEEKRQTEEERKHREEKRKQREEERKHREEKRKQREEERKHREEEERSGGTGDTEVGFKAFLRNHWKGILLGAVLGGCVVGVPLFFKCGAVCCIVCGISGAFVGGTVGGLISKCVKNKSGGRSESQTETDPLLD